MRKRIGAGLAAALTCLALTGCGKDSEVQIVAPRETQDGTSFRMAESSSQLPLRQQLDVPARVEGEAIGREYWGYDLISVNADVEVPDVTGIQVKKVERRQITDEDLSVYQEALFEGNPLLWMPGGWEETREEVLQEYEKMKKKCDEYGLEYGVDPDEEPYIIQQLVNDLEYAPETRDVREVPLHIEPWENAVYGQEEESEYDRKMQEKMAGSIQVMDGGGGMETPVYDGMDMEDPVYDESGMEDPVYDESDMEDPVYDESDMEDPVYGDSDMDDPVYNDEDLDGALSEDGTTLQGSVLKNGTCYNFYTSNGYDYSALELIRVNTVIRHYGEMLDEYAYRKDGRDFDVKEGVDLSGAREKVEELLKDMGMEDFQVFRTENYVASDGLSSYTGLFDRVYIFCCTRVIDGVPVSFPGFAAYLSDEMYVLNNEAVLAAYDEEGMRVFILASPWTVSDGADDPVFLLPFSEIMNIFWSTIESRFVELNGAGNGLSLEIDRIALGYMRSTEEGEEDLLIPVWDFFGHLWQNEDWGSVDYVYPGWEERSWLTVNAMDGTVVSR